VDCAKSHQLSQRVLSTTVGKTREVKTALLLRKDLANNFCRVYTYVKKCLARQLQARPALDLRGPFFVVAIKEGSSEFWHVDWNDDLDGVTWITVVGKWEGGEFCAPQLGFRVPLSPGQIFGVRARVLVHCSTPVTSGSRLVFTCFTDFMMHRYAGSSEVAPGIFMAK
jgi:hypothetical protein